MYNRELEEEYQRLSKEKEALLCEIDVVKEKEALACAQEDNYANQKLLLRKIPLDWVNTTFSTARARITPLISCTFSVLDLNQVIGRLSLSKKPYKIAYCAMLCNDVIDTGNGIVLQLQDPYRSILSYPLKKVSYQNAKNWVSRMLVVKIRITADAMINKEFYIDRVKVLKYTKYGAIKDGNVERIDSSNRIWTNSIDYSNNDCYNILNNLEDYFRKNDYCVYREESSVLNVCNKEIKCSFVILNNKVYYIQDEAKNITDMDMIFLKYNQELIVANFEYAELVYNQYA